MTENPSIDFHKLVEQSTDLIQVVDPAGIILYTNNSWQKTLGFTIDEVVGHSIYDFIVEERREDYRLFRQQLIDYRWTDKFLETRFRSKSGKEVFLEGFMTVKYEGSSLRYTHAILRDVHLRKQHEAHINEIHQLVVERERQLDQLIKNAPDAIIVINENSEIVLWNPKSEFIFGWSESEILGKVLGETIIPEQYRKMHYAGMKRYLSTGEMHVLNKTIDITALKKNGEEFHIALTISKAFHKGANQFIAFIRDISEQKKLESDLKQKQQQLESRNEELANYASMATHDLKEPIRKILTFSDLLINSPALTIRLTPEQIISKIQSEAKKMAALVDGIANLSNISLSKIISPPVSLNDVMDEVMKDLSITISDKKATFEIPSLPVVQVYRTHLYQLFHNLFSNALKYSRYQTPPRVKVVFRQEDAKVIVLSFSDNGLGFDNEFAQKVFEPFQRLHGKEYKGTGIGLAICRKIIEAYGGYISVESKKGEGSTFTFTLPA